MRRVLEAVTGPWDRGNLFAWLKVIALVLLIRWLWFEPFQIPSGSMEPTFYGDMNFFHDDRVAANKFIYGPRIPFTNHRFFRGKDPERWDIVVFRSVEEHPEHKRLVKRIVGLPGERIHIEGGKIHVNGEPLELPKDMPDVYYVSDDDMVRLMNRLANPEDRAIIAQIRERYPMRYGVLEDDQFAVVPDDCYLVLGDNSSNSVDGRCFGWVPNGNLIGRVFCLWWPWDRRRDFTGFTHTWWGRSIPFDVIAAFVLFEVLHRRKRQTAARFSNTPAPPAG